MKKDRQALIARLIGEKEIATQEELLALLIDEGMNVTQATVSRDIKEMGVIKRSDPTGRYRYYLPSESDDADKRRLFDLIVGAVLSGVQVGNLVVVKCVRGSASVVANAVDARNSSLIAGTIAGDDTVLAVCYSEEAASKAKKNLDKILGLE